MKLSLIIPTKNRKYVLVDLLNSLTQQVKIPNEIIVIDQSENEYLYINEVMIFKSYLNLIYIHEPKIKGLVEAKKIGIKIANYELIAFIDDDILLDKNYFEIIVEGFKLNQNMFGCSGFIINNNKDNIFKTLIRNILDKKIFNDPRKKIYESKFFDKDLIKCNQLSGGLSIWRSYVFEKVNFDINNNLHYFEDVDFSLRAFEIFGDEMYINTLAHVKNFPSNINRNSLGKSLYMKLIEGYKLYLKFNIKSRNVILLFFIKYLLIAIYESYKANNIGIFKNYCEAIRIIKSGKVRIY